MHQATMPTVAFVVDQFPHTANPFIISQVAVLQKKGVAVQIYSFKKGDTAYVAAEYHAHAMERDARYLTMARSAMRRFIEALPKWFALLRHHPISAVRALNVLKYGRDALSLKTVYWADFFRGQRCDLAHCHFGPAARRYAIAREILGSTQPFVTTFYGYDVSRVFKEEGDRYYDLLRRECSAFFAMSENMKQRMVEYGFDANKITVNPPGIDVHTYPWKERHLEDTVEVVSIGRLVEKKGFDDLLRALAIVRQRVAGPLRCTIVGDGPLWDDLHVLAGQLGLGDIVNFKGYMRMEDISALLLHAHLYVQPSKTDAAGNME